MSFHFLVIHDMAPEYYMLKTVISSFLAWTVREYNLTLSILMKTDISNLLHCNSSDFKGVSLAQF